MPLCDGIRYYKLSTASKFYNTMNCVYRPDHTTGGVRLDYYVFWSDYQLHRFYKCV